jgi:hypothetical protein
MSFSSIITLIYLLLFIRSSKLIFRYPCLFLIYNASCIILAVTGILYFLLHLWLSVCSHSLIFVFTTIFRSVLIKILYLTFIFQEPFLLFPLKQVSSLDYLKTQVLPFTIFIFVIWSYWLFLFMKNLRCSFYFPQMVLSS